MNKEDGGGYYYWLWTECSYKPTQQYMTDIIYNLQIKYKVKT